VDGAPSGALFFWRFTAGCGLCPARVFAAPHRSIVRRKKVSHRRQIRAQSRMFSGTLAPKGRTFQITDEFQNPKHPVMA
jgi:hypothetical protein